MILATLTVALVADTFDSVLNDPRLRGATLTACVMDPNGNVLYERNADERVVPASNQKLLSCLMALEKLGSEFRPVTRIWDMGDHVFIDAPGNPMVSVDQTLEAAGLLKGRTPVKLRQAYDPGHGPGWESDDFPYYYAAPISALTFDRATFPVVAEKGMLLKPKGNVGVRMVHLGGRGSPRATYSYWKRTVTVRGVLPQVRTLIDSFATPEPAKAAASAFGAPVSSTLEVPPSRPPDATIEGATIADTVKLCLEDSDNVLAENLLLMASEVGPADDPYAKAQEAALDFLSDAEVGQSTDWRPIDGSGLSRHNLATAKGFCELLNWAKTRSYAPIFREALAAPGEGTMKKRLAGSSFVGKTGTMTGVCSLSGYVTRTDGSIWTFSLVFNNTNRSAAVAREVQDKFVKLLENLPFLPGYEDQSDMVQRLSSTGHAFVARYWASRPRFDSLAALAGADRRNEPAYAAGD